MKQSTEIKMKNEKSKVESLKLPTATELRNKVLNGLNINKTDARTGNTILHLACESGRKDIIELLLSDPAINQKVKLDQQNAAGYTAQNILERLNALPLLTLFKKRKAELRKTLGDVVRNSSGNTGQINALLDIGADPSELNTEGDNVFHIACQFGCLEAVRILYEYDPKLLTYPNKKQLLPITKAIKNKDQRVIGYLLPLSLECQDLQDHPQVLTFLEPSNNFAMASPRIDIKTLNFDMDMRLDTPSLLKSMQSGGSHGPVIFSDPFIDEPMPALPTNPKSSMDPSKYPKNHNGQ